MIPLRQRWLYSACKKAIALDRNINPWLLAAAIDRDLMRRNKPQIYGTQYIKNNDEALWRIYDIDTTQVTDEQRKAYNVKTLNEQRAFLNKLNEN
jgi:hypothetical protein